MVLSLFSFKETNMFKDIYKFPYLKKMYFDNLWDTLQSKIWKYVNVHEYMQNWPVYKKIIVQLNKTISLEVTPTSKQELQQLKPSKLEAFAVKFCHYILTESHPRGKRRKNIQIFLWAKMWKMYFYLSLNCVLIIFFCLFFSLEVCKAHYRIERRFVFQKGLQECRLEDLKRQNYYY